MSRIQIRQKIKTAVLGMAIVLGVLVSAGRGDLMKTRSGLPDPVSQQHAASGPAHPQAVRIRMQIESHPVVLRVIGVSVERPCADQTRAT
tara:strand:- start:489 stop:758 length:270 start_codon:yes stop_codon:yes gene_type:complete